jgi:hypothetical protein
MCSIKWSQNCWRTGWRLILKSVCRRNNQLLLKGDRY